MVEEAIKKQTESTYSKTALLNSKFFNVIERDILKIVLHADKAYTMDEVKNEINKFKEGI